MKFWYGLLFCCSLLVGNAARAENFYIENYKTTMQVSEDRKVHVSEDLEVYFTNPSHGIIRSIPLRSSDIKGIKVNAPFSTSISGSDLEIKIGDEYETVSGSVSYHIEYIHQLYSNKPEFYYNLIGTDWGVPINKAYFAVRMPKTVDPDRVGISIGSYGTHGFDGDARFVVRDMDIIGVTQRRLDPNEGITMRVEVPEGYFQNIQNKWAQKVWIWLLLCTLAAFLIWYQYGKDEHVTPVVSFSAPQEITPVEAELVMTEAVSEKGLIALIIKLANDGYLKIKTEGKDFVFSDFKPYKGRNTAERKLLSLLEAQIDKDGKVSKDALKTSSAFYLGWHNLLGVANDDDNKKHYYEKSSVSGIFPSMVLLCVVGNAFLTLFSLFGYRTNIDSILLIVGVFIGLLIFTQNIVTKGKDWGVRIYTFFISLLFLFQMYVELCGYIAEDNISQVIGGLLCVLISVVCYVEMLKPNNKGRMLKGKLLGLKKFIDVAEKDRLERMVEQNPSYFYKVLPYSYILGISRVWIKHFEGIAVPPPEWIIGKAYNINSFDDFARGFHSAVIPSIDNGGISRSSSSGVGGFSGGGSGGGGGRSW